MADVKKKKKEEDKSQGPLDIIRQAYDSAARSGVLGAKTKMTVENPDKQADWFSGKKKKKKD